MWIKMEIHKHLTNTHISEQVRTLTALYAGHEGKRHLYVGKPNATPMITYSQPELIKQGMVGIYEIEQCGCSMCAELLK